MSVSKKDYGEMVKNASSSSPKLKDFVAAFVVGGLICAIGQLLTQAYQNFGLSLEISRPLVSSSLIFVTAILTGIGVFDKIAKFAGAGTLVPITGFANAVVAPAIEYKQEGFVLGIGAKMFTIAGPVILYGALASVIYGIVHWLINYI